MLQFISIIAPVNPLSTLVPLLFAFTLTAVKEGYDDVKRHRQDAAYNSRTRLVLDVASGAWQYKQNAAIRVGDVILLQNNEDMPCDVVAIAASSAAIYIRTDNLDGEIDLKPKEVLTCPQHYHQQHQQSTPSVHRSPAASRGAVSSSAESLDVMSTSSSLMEKIELADDVPLLLEKLKALRLHCPAPNAMVDSFDAVAEFGPETPAVCVTSLSENGHTTATAASKVSLSHRHLLPQSCLLKNTDRVMVVAVYTGSDTKCGMNKRPAPVKWARIDQEVSKYSLFLFCCQMFTAVMFGFIGYFKNRHVAEDFWYLPLAPVEAAASFVIYPLRFFLLTTVMIPVSFKFVVDMSKHYMAMSVEWDSTMHTCGEGCRVKNSNILEDLGQIDYVLSDKTGTLTQNVMELLYVSVAPSYQIDLAKMGVPDSIFASPTVAATTARGDTATCPSSDSPAFQMSRWMETAEVNTFATMLAICNTVEVKEAKRSADINDTATVRMYQAASPDEVALCFGAAKLDVVLESRSEKLAVVSVRGRREEWVIHHVFPFSSNRKSMGVIVESPHTSELLVVLKGADDSINGMLIDGGRLEDHASLQDQLAEYARCGLRTLLLAQKKITHEELGIFRARMRAAELSMEARQEQIDRLRDGMECNMQLLGVTAIEDKLQESVRETVTDLIQAGIKMWMLTGDKVETAEQIGLSCALYNPDDQIIRIVEDTATQHGCGNSWVDTLMNTELPNTAHRQSLPKEQAWRTGFYAIQSILRYGTYTSAEMPSDSVAPSAPTGGRRCVLVVQGGAVLHRIMNSPELSKRFWDLSERCVSVICARTTPSQKAAVTQFVRSHGFMTLCIGDGGNDVAMLQEAHVGVGISGKEGQQAARAADFAIHNFSDLRPLLFVHGQQAYVRTAYVIKYSFYKSMLIAFIQLAYNCVGTYFSGGSYWNSFSLTMWNGCYTLPTTFFYCLDRCAPRVVLERAPALYKMTRGRADMSAKEFLGTFVLRGAIQSVVLLWLISGIYSTSFAYGSFGGAASKEVSFSVAYTALIISQFLTVCMESHSVTYWNALWLLGMPIFYVFSVWMYSSVEGLQYYGVFRMTMGAEGWLAAFGVAFTLTVPCLVYMTVRDAVFPNSRDTLRRAELKRQRALLRTDPVYARKQSMWVRWMGCTPEAPSSYTDFNSTDNNHASHNEGNGSILVV